MMANPLKSQLTGGRILPAIFSCIPHFRVYENERNCSLHQVGTDVTMMWKILRNNSLPVSLAESVAKLVACGEKIMAVKLVGLHCTITGLEWDNRDPCSIGLYAKCYDIMVAQTKRYQLPLKGYLRKMQCRAIASITKGIDLGRKPGSVCQEVLGGNLRRASG